MLMPNLVLPGESLGSTSEYLPGAGTHILDNQLVASLAGRVVVKSKQSSLAAISVVRSAENDGGGMSDVDGAGLPEVDSIILARVTRIQTKQATVGILVVDGRVVGEEWAGVIRSQDVRATEKDRVKIFESFRPGDVVRAVVISLGDQSNYYLSTAKNEFGVVMATSEAGNTMYPVSWKEFADPVSGQKELRKVAKPF